MKRKIALFVLFAFLLPALSSCAPKGDPVEHFQFTDQDGKSFSLDDLKGKVWVADFIFTSCKTVCPPMTMHMSELQEKIKKTGYKDVELVSFSIDPEVDTPQKLKQFANQFHSDFSMWHFLTGYSQKKIEKFAMKNFKNPVAKSDGNDQVVHGTSFYVVNKDGELIKDFDGSADFDAEKIMKEIEKLR
ncbi:SCO family protein [Heyndrickxia coagulans]|uniref:SCO family protein n=1 Tax=Heyndrickxia coagulans TaxID=1398 RepID=UPI002E0386B8|nr:SCO family protein [Heyndrickxia coagulans]